MVREKYNESSLVGLFAAATIFVGIIVIGTTRLVQDSIVAQYLLPTIGMMCINVAMYVLLFMFKIFYLHGIWEDVSESTHSTSGTTRHTTRTKTVSGGADGGGHSDTNNSVKMSRRQKSTGSGNHHTKSSDNV